MVVVPVNQAVVLYGAVLLDLCHALFVLGVCIYLLRYSFARAGPAY